MLISYPKTLPKGRISNNLVSTLDLLPTVLQLSGIDIPSSFDGISLIDNASQDDNNYIYSRIL